MRAQLPSDERERLRVLHELTAPHIGPEPDFDDIVRLAARICGTPMSGVNLIDADRQIVKAAVGAASGITEMPRDESFCTHAILGRGLLVVPDARADLRFADNPYVLSEPGIRFYAGAPLCTSSGHVLGTLCVLDAVPRRLNLGQLRALRSLAQQVTAQLELRKYAGAVFDDTARRHEVERLQDELAPLVAARLREPLNEIRQCAELLRDHDFCTPELAVRLGSAVHAQAPNLVRLLDDLLHIAGPEVGDPPLQRREVDLVSLAEWAVREVRPIADAKDIVLRFDAGGAAPVLADPRRLAQALSHLLFNAVEFTPCEGRVHVRVTTEGSPTVELRDVGVGGEPADLYRHVYRAAIQPLTVDARVDPDAGLAAVKAIFDAHHASVALFDDTQEGTALHVVFPSAA